MRFFEYSVFSYQKSIISLFFAGLGRWSYGNGIFKRYIAAVRGGADADVAHGQRRTIVCRYHGYPINTLVESIDMSCSHIECTLSGVRDFIFVMVLHVFAYHHVGAGNLMLARTVQHYFQSVHIGGVLIIPHIEVLLRRLDEELVIGIDDEGSLCRVAHEFTDDIVTKGEITGGINRDEIMIIEETFHLRTPARLILIWIDLFVHIDQFVKQGVFVHIVGIDAGEEEVGGNGIIGQMEIVQMFVLHGDALRSEIDMNGLLFRYSVYLEVKILHRLTGLVIEREFEGHEIAHEGIGGEPSQCDLTVITDRLPPFGGIRYTFIQDRETDGIAGESGGLAFRNGRVSNLKAHFLIHQLRHVIDFRD